MSVARSSRFTWLVPAGCLIYMGVVLGFFTLRALKPDLPSVLALIRLFALFLFAPLPLAALLAWLSRSRVALLSSASVFALFLGVYVPLFVPRSASANPSVGARFRVLTFNLGGRGAPTDRLVGTIENEAADIVGVEELEPDTAAVLREKLGKRYPYQILEPREHGDVGLLSRYRILSTQWFTPTASNAVFLDAVLDIRGMPIHAFVLHPASPYFLSGSYRSLLPSLGMYEDRQEREFADIAQRVAKRAEPVILMGDLNLDEQSRAYVVLSAVLRDSYREAGWGPGFTFPIGTQIHGLPVPGPFLRLDYIFHSPDLQVQQAEVGCRGGSDHCYVVVRLGK